MLARWLQEVLAGNRPVFILLAGPHGAGKTTFRQREVDPIGIKFINPDDLSLTRLSRPARNRAEAKQSTLDAEKAVRQCFLHQETVGLETVFSDQAGYKFALLNEAKQHGFSTVVIFIGLESSMLSRARVEQRRNEGGHDVADKLIEARYDLCFENLQRAIPIVDLTLLYDNSKLDARHRYFAAIESSGAFHSTPPWPRWFARVKSDDRAQISWYGLGIDTSNALPVLGNNIYLTYKK